jgi:curli biogenesis system outer membrane secretion channel CsgG
MKSVLFAVFAAAGLGLSAQTTLPQGEQAGIYIGEMKIQPSVIETATQKNKQLILKRVAQSLDTQFIASLSATRTFQIVERKRKADIEQEQGFAATAVDLNDKNAAQLGKMAGAKYALLPQIDGFEDLVDIQEYQKIGRTSMRRKIYVSALVQIVDTTTGQLLPDVATAQLTQEEIVENSRNGVGLQGSDAALVELAKKVAASLCQEAVAILRPAKILTVTGKQVLINRGTAAGFEEGLPVKFFAFNEVKDEDSGEMFRNEIEVGQGKITRSDVKQSYADIMGENLGVAKGCVVKPVKRKQAQKETLQPSMPGGAFPEDPRRVPRQAAPETPGSSEKPLNFDVDDAKNDPVIKEVQQPGAKDVKDAPPPAAPGNNDAK